MYINIYVLCEYVLNAIRSVTKQQQSKVERSKYLAFVINVCFYCKLCACKSNKYNNPKLWHFIAGCCACVCLQKQHVMIPIEHVNELYAAAN